MKLTLLLPLTIVMLWSGTIWGATAVNAAQTTGVFNFSLPSIESNFQDLDSRDTDNNPVSTIDAQQGLRDIFYSGLFSLVIVTELYTYARAAEFLAKKLGLGDSSLVATPLALVVRAMETLCTSGLWKNCLTALIASFILAVLAVVRRYVPTSMLSPISVAMAPVVLRC